jgi:hypothetical protein
MLNENLEVYTQNFNALEVYEEEEAKEETEEEELGDYDYTKYEEE